MAKNNSPKVQAARRFAEEFDVEQVIVLAVSYRHGTVEYASYGETAVLCRHARRLADKAYDAVMEELARG